MLWNCCFCLSSCTWVRTLIGLAEKRRLALEETLDLLTKMRPKQVKRFGNLKNGGSVDDIVAVIAGLRKEMEGAEGEEAALLRKKLEAMEKDRDALEKKVHQSLKEELQP